MKLIATKNDNTIIGLFKHSTLIERVDGAIRRITIGDPANPVAVIQKSGAYTDNLDVLILETKKVLRCETEVCGAKICKDFEEEVDRLQWQREMKEQFSGSDLKFIESEVETIA